MVAQDTYTDIGRINKIFESQKANQYTIGASTARERIAKLKRLKKSVENHKQAFRDAMWKDYRKPAAEVDLTEIFIVTTEIKHALSDLRSWMRPQRVSTPLSLLGSSSWTKAEPKGLCLIIAPWNYPLNLCFGPLVSAIAAGNTVMLKPSEYAPSTSVVMRQVLEEVFEENEVAMVEGAIETSTALLALPFNHIFFTGAPEIGKIVMAAAAKNLASVTLELGGKSPTIVDETANINTATTRITWGKYSNNGQICIAPDYAFVHESRIDEFLEKMGKKIKEFYGDDPSAESSNYMRVINARHLNRVKSYLDNSVAAGARVVHGGQSDASKNYLAPTVVTNVPLDSDLMQKEIFGPILPVLAYSNLDEVIAHIRQGEKPLALYIYSKNRKNINKIIAETRAGGTAINHNGVHFFNTNLPFGGSNNSGLGKSHGKFGFDAFSNLRGFYKQNIPGALEMLMPPYNGFKQKLIDLTIKWF